MRFLTFFDTPPPVAAINDPGTISKAEESICPEEEDKNTHQSPYTVLKQHQPFEEVFPHEV